MFIFVSPLVQSGRASSSQHTTKSIIETGNLRQHPHKRTPSAEAGSADIVRAHGGKGPNTTPPPNDRQGGWDGWAGGPHLTLSTKSGGPYLDSEMWAFAPRANRLSSHPLKSH